MPTANAVGQIESEGSVGKVSPSDRHRSSAFAVGMLRDIDKKKTRRKTVKASVSCVVLVLLRMDMCIDMCTGI